MESPADAYTRWSTDPSTHNMSAIVNSLSPTINAEVQRYPGPKPLLRTKAKQLTIDAVKSYDPMSKAKLNSWIVTQLQPLSRYGREVATPVHVSELAFRQAAAVEAVRQQLADDLGDEPTDDQIADEVGISPTRIKHLRDTVRPVAYDAAFQIEESSEAVEPSVVNMGTDPSLDAAVEMVLDGLDDRDKLIYELKTGIGGKAALDNQSIAKRLGITPSYVSQRSAIISQQILETMGRV